MHVFAFTQFMEMYFYIISVLLVVFDIAIELEM